MTFLPVEPRRIGTLAASPLRLALVQARTPPVLAFERAEAVERLLQALDGRWTVTDRQSNREVAVQIGPGGVREDAAAPELVWVLSSEDGRTRAAVSSSSVAVESDSYDRWDLFRGHIRDVLTAVAGTVAPKRCVRLGVRYVNEIDVSRAEGNPAQMAEQLNDALLAPALAFARPLLGSLAELRVGEDDGAVFVLRHGLVNPATYLLDFDAYIESDEDFDAELLAERVERFHDRIESVFAWSLTDAYLEALRSGRNVRP